MYFPNLDSICNPFLQFKLILKKVKRNDILEFENFPKCVKGQCQRTIHNPTHRWL